MPKVNTYVVEYDDPCNPGFVPDSWSVRAFSIEHALERFAEADDGFRALRVRQVTDRGKGKWVLVAVAAVLAGCSGSAFSSSPDSGAPGADGGLPDAGLLHAERVRTRLPGADDVADDGASDLSSSPPDVVGPTDGGVAGPIGSAADSGSGDSAADSGSGDSAADSGSGDSGSEPPSEPLSEPPPAPPQPPECATWAMAYCCDEKRSEGLSCAIAAPACTCIGVQSAVTAYHDQCRFELPAEFRCEDWQR